MSDCKLSDLLQICSEEETCGHRHYRTPVESCHLCDCVCLVFVFFVCVESLETINPTSEYRSLAKQYIRSRGYSAYCQLVCVGWSEL